MTNTDRSIQNNLSAFAPDSAEQVRDPPYRPDDSELEHHIAPSYLYDEFDTNKVIGIHELRQDIRETVFARDPVEKWSKILKRHLSRGNGKLAKSVKIFNLGGSATDCRHLGTPHCQVDKDDCYAYNNECDRPDHVRDSRRRERIIWDHLDAATFAKAFRRVVDRGRTETVALRFNESGEFQSRHDMFKADEVARRLSNFIVYTYSTAYDLPWNQVDHLVVNRSSNQWPFGDRRFEVVDSVSEIPSGGIRCPHDASGGDIKCGTCRLCLNQGPGPHIYVLNQYADEEDSDSDTTNSGSHI